MVSNKKKLTKEEEKALLLLKSTYEMHCKTKEEAILRGKTANIDKIDGIINDTVSQMAKIDKEFAEKCVKEHKNNSKKLYKEKDIKIIHNINEKNIAIKEIEFKIRRI